MKPKMSIDNKACVEAQFKKLIELTLLFAVFSPIVLAFIKLGAEGIATSSLTRYDELVAANGSSILITLYGLLANDAIVEVILISVFIFVIIFTLLAMIKTKGRR